MSKKIIVFIFLTLLLSCQKNNADKNETGKIAEVTQGGNILSYAYDAQGRLISRTAPEGNAIYTYTPSMVTEKIDAAGGLVTLVYELNSQGLVNKSYNQDSAQFFTTYEYDGNGMLMKETYSAQGNGVIETIYYYSAAGNPDSAVSKKFNNVIQKKIFEFDSGLTNVIAADKFGISIFGKDANYLIGKQTEITPAGGTIINTYAYEFDNAGRVTRIIQRQAGTTQEQITDYHY